VIISINSEKISLPLRPQTLSEPILILLSLHINDEEQELNEGISPSQIDVS
jgi:hypothetical protein